MSVLEKGNQANLRYETKSSDMQNMCKNRNMQNMLYMQNMQKNLYKKCNECVNQYVT